MAHLQWAFGAIDEAEFRGGALCGLYVALLGVATDRARPGTEAELAKLESALRGKRQLRRRRSKRSA